MEVRTVWCVVVLSWTFFRVSVLLFFGEILRKLLSSFSSCLSQQLKSASIVSLSWIHQLLRCFHQEENNRKMLDRLLKRQWTQFKPSTSTKQDQARCQLFDCLWFWSCTYFICLLFVFVFFHRKNPDLCSSKCKLAFKKEDFASMAFIDERKASKLI